MVTSQLEKKKACLPRCKPCIRESRLILFYYGPMSLNETMINASTDVPLRRKFLLKIKRLLIRNINVENFPQI